MAGDGYLRRRVVHLLGRRVQRVGHLSHLVRQLARDAVPDQARQHERDDGGDHDRHLGAPGVAGDALLGGGEFVEVRTRADHPVPRREVDESCDLVAGRGIALVLPGVDLLADLAGPQGLGLGHDLLDERGAGRVLRLPEVLAVALAALGDDVVALAVQHVDVAGVADADVHDRLPQRRRALQRHAEVGHADDGAVTAAQRLVRGHVPAVDDEGAALVGAAGQHVLQHRVGLAVGIDGRDVGADRAAILLRQHVRADAQHVAGIVHALEDGGGAAGETAHVVDDGARRAALGVLAEPGVAGLEARQGHGRGGLRELVHGLPFHRVGAEAGAARAVQGVAGDGQAVGDGILQHRLLRGTHGPDAADDVLEVGRRQPVDLGGGGMAHAVLGIDDDRDDHGQGNGEQQQAGREHAGAQGTTEGHGGILPDAGTNVRKSRDSQYGMSSAFRG